MNRRELLPALSVAALAFPVPSAAPRHSYERWTVRWVKEVWNELNAWGKRPEWMPELHSFRAYLASIGAREMGHYVGAHELARIVVERDFDSADEALAYVGALVRRRDELPEAGIVEAFAYRAQ